MATISEKYQDQLMQLVDADTYRSIKDVAFSFYPDVPPLTDGPALAIGHQEETYKIFSYLREHGINQFIQQGNDDDSDYILDLRSAALLATAPQAVFRSPRTSLLPRKPFSQDPFSDLDSKPTEFASLLDKPVILSDLGGYLNEHTSTANARIKANAVADELMNIALLYSPASRGGELPNATVGTSQLTYPADHAPARFFFDHDDKYLLLGCYDAFGTLNHEALLAGLEKAHHQPGEELDLSPAQGGAVFSLKTVLDHSSHLYLITMEGASTLLAAIVPYNELSLQRPLGKSVHFCNFYGRL